MIQINEFFETQHGVLWHNAQKDFCAKEKTITIYSAILGKLPEKTTISSSSKNTYQQMKNDMYRRTFDVIDGFQCESLESVLALKRRLLRPKDIRDIEVIEAYLKEHGNKGDAHEKI